MIREEVNWTCFKCGTKIDPKQNAEKALTLDYDYKVELDRTVSIGAFLAK